MPGNSTTPFVRGNGIPRPGIRCTARTPRGSAVPRRERPLDDGDSASLRLAADLRVLRQKAGSPTYRELARLAHYSVATLSEAAAGGRLPSLAVTVAYATACGADPAEWERRWHAAAGEAAQEEAAARPAVARDDGSGGGRAPYVGLSACRPSGRRTPTVSSAVNAWSRRWRGG
ncbi:helix-turn-helix domain-containing protein [Streptomyces griseoviridis]